MVVGLLGGKGRGGVVQEVCGGAAGGTGGMTAVDGGGLLTKRKGINLYRPNQDYTTG